MAGKNVNAFRRVLFAQYPPMRLLDGKIIRRETTEPIDGTIFAQVPSVFCRFLPSKPIHPSMLVGHARRSPAKPPQWLKYTQTLNGYYRVADVGQYELYIGEDALPDFSAPPAATSTSLPFDYSITPPLVGTKDVYITVRYRNEYDLVSLDQFTTKYTIDTSGNIVRQDPSSPQDLLVREASGYRLTVTAEYHYAKDGDDKADTWQLYYTTTGVDPDPLVDTPIEEEIKFRVDIAFFGYALGPFSADTDVRVLLRVKRSSDGADDGNSTVVQHTMTSAMDTPSYGSAFGGGVYDNR
ncbi:MAG: hypothetical protein DRN14_00245 [Thermoplasmata archaeon]|nr:MAG: hypothetical protein DRN14_00245 [Thermoplasmata archaeon]